MRFAPARRRGYAKRYLRHQLGQHGMELLLAAAFLLGVLLGCWMTSGENTRLVEQLNGLLSAQQGSFLMQVVGSFAAVAALLLILFLSGLGAVFQPLVPLVLFWRGMGFGALGVCSYAAGQPSNTLYYLLVLLPRALGEVLLLICAGGCARVFPAAFSAHSSQEKVVSKRLSARRRREDCWVICCATLFFIFWAAASRCFPLCWSLPFR